MKTIMTKIRGDHCGCCNTQRSIEIYDKYDRPVNYTYLLDNVADKDMVVRFNNRELAHMKCKKCGKVYCIDWRDIVPMPLREFMLIDNFMFDHYNK